MAVTRHCYTFEVNSWEPMKALQEGLNNKLGPQERIVHMGQKENHSGTWYVITEELIMGPIP